MAKKNRGNTPIMVRMDERNVAMLDRLVDLFGVNSRSTILRMALKQMHDREFPENQRTR